MGADRPARQERTSTLTSSRRAAAALTTSLLVLGLITLPHTAAAAAEPSISGATPAATAAAPPGEASTESDTISEIPAGQDQRAAIPGDATTEPAPEENADAMPPASTDTPATQLEDAPAADAAPDPEDAGHDLTDHEAPPLILEDSDPGSIGGAGAPAEEDRFAELELAASAATDSKASAISVSRVSGQNRYDTAVAVSKHGFTQASTVYLASGTTFPDALGGGAAAAQTDAPMLLTEPGKLPAKVAAEIRRLGAKKVIIVGGTGAVSAGVANQAKKISGVSTVSRMSGQNRYDTAVAVSKAGFKQASTVYLASGATFPDALGGGAAAAQLDAPMLLTEPGKLPAKVAAEIKRLGAKKVIIVGGTGAVSAGVANQAKKISGVSTVSRVSGLNRYDTAVAVSKAGFKQASTVYLASGTTFPDALGGGAAAAQVDAPMLLTEPGKLPAKVAAEIRRLGAKKVIIVGGTGAVSAGVANQVKNIASTAPKPPTTDPGTNTYVYWDDYFAYPTLTALPKRDGQYLPDEYEALVGQGVQVKQLKPLPAGAKAEFYWTQRNNSSVDVKIPGWGRDYRFKSSDIGRTGLTFHINITGKNVQTRDTRTSLWIGLPSHSVGGIIADPTITLEQFEDIASEEFTRLVNNHAASLGHGRPFSDIAANDARLKDSYKWVKYVTDSGDFRHSYEVGENLKEGNGLAGSRLSIVDSEGNHQGQLTEATARNFAKRALTSWLGSPAHAPVYNETGGGEYVEDKFQSRLIIGIDWNGGWFSDTGSVYAFNPLRAKR